MYKEIITQRKFINYKNCKQGELLVEGKLIKTVPNKFGKGNVDWVFEPKDGGPHVVLNHAGSLAYIFDQYGVDIGDSVKIAYDGQEVLEKGVYKGNPVHNFRVWVSEEKQQQSKEEEVRPLSVPQEVELPQVSIDEFNSIEIETLE